MKRWIHASLDLQPLQEGDAVTVYNGTHGYSNYDGVLIDEEINKYGVKIAVVDTGKRIEKVPMSSIIPSQKKYFRSLTIDDVTTKEFIAQMIYKDDSIWCDKIRYDRVDRDTNMENVVGVDAMIKTVREGEQNYRVVISDYISKHGSITTDTQDEWDVKLDSRLIYEALDILKRAKEVVVNFAGYQRVFKR